MISISRKERNVLGLGALATLLVGLFQNLSTIAPEAECLEGTASARVECAIRRATEFAKADGRAVDNERLVLHAVDRLGFGMSPQTSELSSAKTRASAPKILAASISAQLDDKAALRSEHVALIKNQLVLENLTETQQYSLALALSSMIRLLQAEIASLEDRGTPVPEEMRTTLLNLNLRANLLRGEAERSMVQRKLITNLVGSMSWTIPSAAVDEQLNLGDVMTEFWFNHFNVDRKKVDRYTVNYDEVIRRHSFGTFRGLLSAVMHTPTMLVYLDNQSNIRQKIGDTFYGTNQNLARELLELHTTGRGPVTTRASSGDYTQIDIENVARVLTGHGLSMTTSQIIEGRPSHYFFNAAAHVPAGVVPEVMGQKFPQPGEQKATALYAFLANLPRTKANICSKLVIRLAGPSNTEWSAEERKWVQTSDSRILNRRCIAAWGTDGDITKMFVAIVSSPEYWNPARFKGDVKSPLELVLSAHRAAGADPASILASLPTTTDTAIFADGRTVRVHGGNRYLSGISSDIQKLGLAYRGIVPPTGYSENRLSWLNPSYVVNAATVLHSSIGGLADARISTGVDYAQLREGRTGFAAHSEFDRIFVYRNSLSRTPASTYEIDRYVTDSFGHQVIASGPKTISGGFKSSALSSERLADSDDLDMIRSDQFTGLPETCERRVGSKIVKGYCSALRTAFVDYVTSKDFLTK